MPVVFATILASGACSSNEPGVSSGDDTDCTSHYQAVGRAESRAQLDVRLTNHVHPSVVRLRVQGTHAALTDAGQPAESVALLTTKGRRVMQVDVFQRPSGQWYAGQWQQCID